MTVRTVTLESPAGRLDLLTTAGQGSSVQVGVTGWGLPVVGARAIAGAGDGATYRGSRVASREIVLPVRLESADADIEGQLSLLARILAPRGRQTARLTRTIDGVQWWVDVVWAGGGDWGSSLGATDGRTYLYLTLTLLAPDPYWTRSDALQLVARASGLGRGLIKEAPLSELRVSSGQALGDMSLENPGDAESAPVVYVDGPGTGLTSVGPDGVGLSWSGVLLAGERLVFDHAARTVTDAAGVSRYHELGPVPRFWRVPPGASRAQAALVGATSASAVTVSWRPRRWAVI